MGAGSVPKTEDGKNGSWKGRRCRDFECGVKDRQPPSCLLEARKGACTGGI